MQYHLEQTSEEDGDFMIYLIELQALLLMQQKEVEELVMKCILLFTIIQVNNLDLM